MARQVISDEGPGRLLAVQTKVGAAEVYSSGFTGAVAVVSDGGAGSMQIAYTPTVDCWWETMGHFSIVECQTAAYCGCYVNLELNVLDEQGLGLQNSYGIQHSQVNAVMQRHMDAIWKLKAGRAYTCALAARPGSGQWRYYCGPGQLMLQGKAWSL